MSAPQPLQIREANAHLAAVHRRAAELEERLHAAERTVSAQAELLAQHDQQLRAALDELGRAKDRENTVLEQLSSAEATVQNLQAALHQRDALIEQLQPRARLLHDICRHRPTLAGLLAALADGERLGPPPARPPPAAPLPTGASTPLANNIGEEEDDLDDLPPAVLGTTV
ncbi:vimentin-type intermediate filament-associated coiled-coil protein [Suncus etruscus]|uniref:vimentin-type intermediate filament-associated coiled-coil protein n=1 Tax=Suncus etruscus TaxID=109475 RepID=UPI002110469D|nr:vimentin-type intermediate filament-associated coiled-coil protein [Suncus etruscus]